MSIARYAKNITRSPEVIAWDCSSRPAATSSRSCNTCQPPNQSRAAVATGIKMDHEISIPRVHHHASSSLRTSKWFERIQFDDSVRCREKLRTTRAPPKDSVTIASQCCRVPRILRHRGRMRLIHVRCVKNTIGKSTSEQINNRQSTNNKISRIPRSWITALHGL